MSLMLLKLDETHKGQLCTTEPGLIPSSMYSPLFPHLLPRAGRDAAPSKASHSHREVDVHTAQELHFSYFILLALPGLKTEPDSID